MKGYNLYSRKVGHPEADSRLPFKFLPPTDNSFPRASQQDLGLDLFNDMRRHLFQTLPVVLRDKEKG
jgi:hypothetical protein